MRRSGRPRLRQRGSAAVLVAAGALLGGGCGVFDTPDAGVQVAPATDAPLTDAPDTEVSSGDERSTPSGPSTTTPSPWTTGVQRATTSTERIAEDDSIPEPVVEGWTFERVPIPEEGGPSWAASVDPVQQPFSGAAAFKASIFMGDAQVLVLRADPSTADASTRLVATMLLHREGLAAGLADGTTVVDHTVGEQTVVQGRGGIEAWNAWYSDGFAYVVQAGTERTVETLTEAMLASQADPVALLPDDPSITAPVVAGSSFTRAALDAAAPLGWAVTAEPQAGLFSGAATFDVAGDLGSGRVAVLRVDPAEAAVLTEGNIRTIIHRRGEIAGGADLASMTEDFIYGQLVVKGRDDAEHWDAWYRDGAIILVQADRDAVLDDLATAIVGSQLEVPPFATLAESEGDLGPRLGSLVVLDCSVLPTDEQATPFVLEYATTMREVYGMQHTAVRKLACGYDLTAVLTAAQPAQDLGSADELQDFLLLLSGGTPWEDAGGARLMSSPGEVMWYRNGIVFLLDSPTDADGNPTVSNDRLEVLRDRVLAAG